MLVDFILIKLSYAYEEVIDTVVYEMNAKISSENWVKAASTDPQPYASFNAVCNHLLIASKGNPDLAETILGCKTKVLDNGNTKLKVYFDAASVEAQTECQKEELNSILDEWKKMVGVHFKVNSAQLDLKRKTFSSAGEYGGVDVCGGSVVVGYFGGDGGGGDVGREGGVRGSGDCGDALPEKFKVKVSDRNQDQNESKTTTETSTATRTATETKTKNTGSDTISSDTATLRMTTAPASSSSSSTKTTITTAKESFTSEPIINASSADDAGEPSVDLKSSSDQNIKLNPETTNNQEKNEGE
ncbi:unnamed protein product [Echinostoma caproni]|uniref:Ras-associating domain-containing protein n=1 Tax=Echinostoma caproni TaxID=27848 RepID=A0A183AIU7_9TREM|nr:unnamed protein product [Echinostoma caproni]